MDARYISLKKLLLKTAHSGKYWREYFNKEKTLGDKAKNIIFILKRVRDHIQDPKKIKERYALVHWKKRKVIEGVLSNKHYECFYTIHFGIDKEFYRDKKILDIGCGPRGSLEWADNTAERIGLDPFVKAYMKLGADKHKMKYIEACAEKMPFPNGYFDVVSSFNSLDHVDNLEQTIKEIKRVTKTRGIFLLLTDIRTYPTVCEPQVFPCDVVNKFRPEFRTINIRHYKKDDTGNMDVIMTTKPYYHNGNTPCSGGILSVIFKKYL